MRAFFTALFGGGSSYLYLILTAAIGGLYWQYTATMKANDRLKAEIEIAETALAQKDATIASQARTAARRQSDGQDAKDIQKGIDDAPKTNLCGASGAIRFSLDGLRERSKGEAVNPTD